jgi:MEMO1 family protein
METRKAVVAGQFYPSNPIQLTKSIEASFKHELGPRMPRMAVPEDGIGKFEGIIGAVCPHAGYPYSGMCAAHSFKAIRESGDYDLFIIMGFSHSGYDGERSSTLSLDWETPLGIAEVEPEVVKLLLKETSLAENYLSMSNEHSIEVQLPFFQFLFKNFKFVPISVSPYSDFKKLAGEIRAVIDRIGLRVCYVASSDFTHYGGSFDYVPFNDNIPKNLKKLDLGAIELVKKKDPAGLQKYVQKTGATICGTAPLSLLLELVRQDSKEGELLKYYTSGDLTGDYGHCVSYASIVFDKT